MAEVYHHIFPILTFYIHFSFISLGGSNQFISTNNLSREGHCLQVFEYYARWSYVFYVRDKVVFCINVFTKVYNEHLHVHLDWGTGKQKKMSGQANADDIVWTQTLPCAFKRGNICGFFICTMNSQNYNSRMKNKLIKYFCHCIHIYSHIQTELLVNLSICWTPPCRLNMGTYTHLRHRECHPFFR